MSEHRSDRRSNAGFDIDDVSSIGSPADEFDFWLRVRDVDKALKDISSIAELNAMEIASVTEFVDSSRDSLNNIWHATSGSQDNLVYSQSRMAHFLDCIGNALVTYVQQQLMAVDLWSSLTSGVRMRLQGCIRICEQWCAIPQKLTYQWEGAPHRWEGSPHVDVFSAGFLRRLQQVLSILTISEELSQILTPEEKATFQLGRLFEPLRETNPVLYNHGGAVGQSGEGVRAAY